MAKCERKQPEPPPVEYVLSLTRSEAEALRRLLGQVAGNAQALRDVFCALANAGLTGKGFRFFITAGGAVRVDADV